MKVLIVALVAAASIAVLAAIPSPASADTQVVVPSTGPWTDTGVDVSAGQQLEMINTAGWSEGNEPVSDADGSPKAWPDNFLNLTDLGVGPYEAQTLTPTGRR